MWRCVLLLLALVSCRERPVLKTAPPKPVVAAAPDAHTPKRPRKPRRRLPPPLRPSTQVGPPAKGLRDTPCDVLVNRVCALLSEGAEECTEARARVDQRPTRVDDDACAEALDWFRMNVEETKRGREPCSLLVDVKCRSYGDESNACGAARSDVAHLKPALHRGACLAELLMFMAFR